MKTSNRKTLAATLLVSVALHVCVIVWAAAPNTSSPTMEETGILLTMVIPAESPVVETSPPPLPEQPQKKQELTKQVPRKETLNLEMHRESPIDNTVATDPSFDVSMLTDIVRPVEMPLGEDPAPAEAEVVVEVAPDPVAEASYEQLVAAWLARHKRYPKLALRKHIEGECLVRIVIKRSGHIEAVSLSQVSGHEMLDREALAMVERANPFPQMPTSLTGEARTYEIPVLFSIDH